MKVAVRFAVAMLLATLACAALWSATVNRWLYDCTDSVYFDYLQPGHWVHGQVAVVASVVRDRSMSEPDTLRAGWSVAGLWALWFAFVAASVVFSAWFAFPGRSREVRTPAA